MPVLRRRRHSLVLKSFLSVFLGTGLTILEPMPSMARAEMQAAAAQANSGAMLPQPEGQVILRISGDLERGNIVDDTQTIAEFDLEMLRHFEAKTISTSTIWSSGRSDFLGVPLAVVLKAVGAEGRTLRLTALNDYTIDMPVEMIEAEVPILAYEMNGALLSSRDKGPLWVIYPFDNGPQYQNEESYSRAVWQLVRIEALP